MTRLAEGRSTHLERSEIAAETLRLFDQGSDPSIRQLAKELMVTPSAIYHHFESRNEIVKAARKIDAQRRRRGGGSGHRPIAHVGMSLGGWQMVHASRTRNGVYVDDVQSVPHLADRFVAASTFVNAS